METEMNATQRRCHVTVKAAAESGRLDKICTPTEARRMRAYSLDGMLLKEIAWDEKVGISSVRGSIWRGLQKLQEAAK